DVLNIPLAIFNCPSDGERTAGSSFSTEQVTAPGNYVVCVGSGVGTNSLTDNKTDGAFYKAQNAVGTKTNGDHGLESMTDGTSNTMILSEALVGNPATVGNIDLTGMDASGKAKIFQRAVLDSKQTPAVTAGENEDMVAFSANVTMTQEKQERCAFWLSPRWDHTVYNAYLMPNQKNAANYWTRGVRDMRGFLKATSSHPGGVNVCYGDGSIRFISDSIALDTWRALSTTSGGEVH
ncbi:MAG: DUF1559 domain-containing protein, partial [Planctomycetaceae bacterium]|nr:DUF1559 domain-containing protein [Planctomycetaceae bacterium]